MVKIKFEIAKPEQIAEWIFHEFKNAIIGNVQGVDANLIFIEFPEEIKEKIRTNSQLTEELKKELFDEIIKTTPKNLDILKYKLEEKWEQDGEKIIEEIERLTEQKFYQKEITCFINNVVCSCCLKKDIVLGFKNVPDKIEKIDDFVLMIIGEELLHLHYETLLHKMPELANKQFNQFKEWQVSEVLPEFILLENENLDYLDKNPKKNNSEKFYPWLSDVKEKIKPIWDERDSFRDFVLKVYKDYNSD